MAIRLPTVANIDYFDPNKVSESLVISHAGLQALNRWAPDPTTVFYGEALTGDFSDSGLNVGMTFEDHLVLPVDKYVALGLVVPGPSVERNNLPLTYGVSINLGLRTVLNHRLPFLIPFVASVVTYTPASSQQVCTFKGISSLNSHKFFNQQSDYSGFMDLKTQLTYNTFGNLSRVIFGVVFYNPWDSEIRVTDGFGHISVNALHHLREIFDPNLG